MLNQTILVGKVEDIKDSRVVIKTTRNYRNQDTGEFDSDYIKVYLTDGLIDNDRIKAGMTIAIKGRLEQLYDAPLLSIVAEKLSFIDSGDNE
jgi:single-stranded DNA-binding protein